MRKIFVTGIGTDVGKTLVSAILTEALAADYWKPIQSGSLETTDTTTVQNLVSNLKSRFHPEAYLLKAPLSPHAAAALEGITIEPERINVPVTENHLIIEGAGGLLVPLAPNFLVVDLIQHLKAEVVVVSRNYLGSINHTLLTLEVLKSRQIPVTGIIFNGEPNESTEEFILKYSQQVKLLSVLPEKNLSRVIIQKYAEQVRINLLNR